MITSWQLYWITRLESIQNFCVFMGTFLGATCFILAVVSGISKSQAYGNDDDSRRAAVCWKMLLKIIPIPIFLFFIAVFVPSTKEMAAIIVLPKIVNNPKVQELPNNLVDLANEWLKELKPEAKK